MLLPILSMLMIGVSALVCSAGLTDELDFLTPVHSRTEEKGVTFLGEYTGEIFGNLSGGIRQGAAYEGLLKLTLELDLKKIVDWDGASLSASTLYPHGNGLSRRYTGDLNMLSNIDAYNSYRLFEFWFQQRLFDDKASIRIGQMSADVEFYQSEWANIFINSCFGTFPTISLGTNLPIYPVGGLGARLEFQPAPRISLRAAVFDSNPGQANANDQHGVRFHLNPSAGIILLAEAVYRIEPSADNGGKQESFTMGAYYDSRRYTGQFVDPTHCSNGGLYVIVDGFLYRRSAYVNEQSSLNGLGGFASAAFAPAAGNEVSFYADCGLNYTGLLPGRENDVLGLALSYTKISSDFLVRNIPVRSGHETVLEVTYRLQVSDKLSLQPDFQYIFDPGAFQHRSNAIVAGLRYDLKF